MDERTIVALADNVTCLEVDGTRSIDIKLPHAREIKTYTQADLERLEQLQHGSNVEERVAQNYHAFNRGKSATIATKDFPVIMAEGGILYLIDDQVGEKYFLLIEEDTTLSIPRGYPQSIEEILDPRKLMARRSVDIAAVTIDGRLFVPPVGPRMMPSVDMHHCDEYARDTAKMMEIREVMHDQMETAERALNKDFVQLTADGHYAVAFRSNVHWDRNRSTLAFVRGVYIPFVRVNQIQAYDKQGRNHVLWPVFWNENYAFVLPSHERVHKDRYRVEETDRDILDSLTPRLD